jgi:hypothetical protein
LREVPPAQWAGVLRAPLARLGLLLVFPTIKMKAISTPVILTRVSTRSDGSLGLSLSTPELQPDAKLAFLEAHGKECRMVLQPEDESIEKLVDVKGEFDTKTSAQRLRGVLFVAWKQANEPGDFQSWYQRRMEGFIESVKRTLLPEDSRS